MELIIEEVDVSRVDVRENLLSDLARLVYEAALSHAGSETLGNANDEFIISRVVNAGIGDLMAQIGRVEELMRKCRVVKSSSRVRRSTAKSCGSTTPN